MKLKKLHKKIQYEYLINNVRYDENEFFKELKKHNNFYENYGCLLASGCCLQDNIVFEMIELPVKESEDF